MPPNTLNTYLRLALLCISASVVSACATGKSVRNADDIIDDGKRNTMLVSYDITLNTTDRYSTFNRTKLVVRCGAANRLGVVPVCFEIIVPFEGVRNKGDFQYNTFRTAGSKVLQIPYGVYDFSKLEHLVTIDYNTTLECKENKKGKTICNPKVTPVTILHKATPNKRPAISIEPGVGCYAGHLNLEMTESNIELFELDQTVSAPSEETLEQISAGLRDTVRSHVTQACVPG